MAERLDPQYEQLARAIHYVDKRNPDALQTLVCAHKEALLKVLEVDAQIPIGDLASGLSPEVASKILKLDVPHVNIERAAQVLGKDMWRVDSADLEAILTHVRSVCMDTVMGGDVWAGRIPENRLERRKISQNLEGKDLSGIVFNEVDFTGSTFRGANLTNATFRKCTIGGCDFANANLTGATFCEHKFSAKDAGIFDREELKTMKFNDCSLRGLDLSGRDLSGIVFNDCGLVDVKFDGANLDGASFVSNSYGRSSNLMGGVSFNKANLNNASLRELRLYSDGKPCDFRGATFENLELTRSALLSTGDGVNASFDAKFAQLLTYMKLAGLAVVPNGWEELLKDNNGMLTAALAGFQGRLDAIEKGVIAVGGTVDGAGRGLRAHLDGKLKEVKEALEALSDNDSAEGIIGQTAEATVALLIERFAGLAAGLASRTPSAPERKRPERRD